MADSLPSKTVPSNVRRQQSASAKAKGKRPAKKRKSQPAEPSRVPQVVAQVQAKEKVTLGHSIKSYFRADKELQVGQGGGGKRNPIYLFYEQVDVNHDGKVGGEGDKHYKCYHGSRKTLTITKQMKTSLNGTFDIFCSYVRGHLTSVSRIDWTFKDFVPSHVPIVSCYEGPQHASDS